MGRGHVLSVGSSGSLWSLSWSLLPLLSGSLLPSLSLSLPPSPFTQL